MNYPELAQEARNATKTVSQLLALIEDDAEPDQDLNDGTTPLRQAVACARTALGNLADCVDILSDPPLNT